MKFKRCRYYIADTYYGQLPVEGYAVKCDSDVRFAVRKVSSGYWKVDHWDTGFSLARGTSKLDAVQDVLRVLERTGPERLREQVEKAKLKGGLNWNAS